MVKLPYYNSRSGNVLNFFRKKSKDTPTSFKTLFFKEPGTQPLTDIDFSKYNVFQINDFNLRENANIYNFYQEMVNTSFYFEVWTIPTISNPKSSVISFIEKVKDKKNAQLQTYVEHLKKSTEKIRYMQINISYLIVNKKHSEIVEDKFNKHSFNLKSVNSNEAKKITVLNVEG